MRLPDAHSFVIRGADVLTMDPTLGDLVGDVAIQDGRIASVGTPVPDSSGEVIDAAGMVLLPGFVDTHRHTWQACLRFAAVGWSLLEYMQNLQQHLAPRFSPEDVYTGNLLGAVTAIDAGITTLRDESHVQNSPAHGDAAVAALRDSGIRASFGHGWPSSVEYMTDSSLPHPADLERMREKILRDDDALVTMHAHLRGPALSTMETTVADLRRARDLGLRSSIHIGAELTPGVREVDLLDRERLLGEDLTFVHCCTTPDEDIRRMAVAGCSASVTALIEAAMPGLGRPATARLLRGGVRPSFGVDIEGAAGGDLFSVMRAALHAHQLLRSIDPAWEGENRAFGPRDLLEFATIDGARACGLGDRTGSITPGKAADLVLLRADEPNLTGARDLPSAVVAAGHPGNVDTVFVAGQAVKRHGALVGHDLAAVAGLAAQSTERLFAGLESR